MAKAATITRAKQKRIYRDPPDADRCEHTSNVPRGELGRCGRRKVIGPYCRQHAAAAARSKHPAA